MDSERVLSEQEMEVCYDVIRKHEDLTEREISIAGEAFAAALSYAEQKREGERKERNAKDRELSQILTAFIHNFRTYGPGSINGELIDQIELSYQHLHDEEVTP